MESAGTVTAVAATSDSLRVTPVAPESTARRVVSYDARYRQGSSGPFTTWPIRVTGGASAATFLVGLHPDTVYEVQVRAYTDDGYSRWSPSGTARTNVDRPTPPTADAGPDLVAPAGARVTLLGSGSNDPHREHWKMTRMWRQLSGPGVTLNDRFAAEPSFTVPRRTALGTVFGFELMLMDRDRETDTDTVTVTVGRTATRRPEFVEGTGAARAVVENTAAGVAIGEPVTATDADGDTLTYSVDGTDAASFEIDAATGQLKTKTGVAYDFETTTAYSVMVEAEDGRGGVASIAVAIEVTDQDEAPATPPAPTVTAVPGTTDRLKVVANTPVNTGPPIYTYNVRYREGAEGEFTGRSTTELGENTTTLTGLEANTVYEVQVRAVSDEGAGAWSESGTGTTEALVGTPPTANAGPDLEALPGSTVTLQGRDSTNPHGAWYELAHRWVQREGPAVTLSDPTRGDPSFDVPAGTAVGTEYTFALTVTDEESESDTDEMTVRVVATLGATPPAANAGPDMEAEPGETVTLQGTGSTNPHGTWWRMAHRWTQTEGPEVTLSDPTRGAPSFTVPADAPPGTVFAFALTVTDKDGETDTDAMTVTVPGGVPVAADAGPDLTVAPGATVTLGTEAEAVEGWTWAWTQPSGPSVALTGADTPRASFAVPADAADGTVYGFALTVTDTQGGEATDETAVTVARPASACRTDMGSLGVGGSADRGVEYWDNPECRAHHRVDRPARYFRFTLRERATVAIEMTTQATAALFVSKDEPKNGWGTPAKGGMAHRLEVRRANGKLVHEEARSASVVLAPGAYTAEAVLDADGAQAWRVASFALAVVAAAPPAAVSVANARVEEGPGAELSFAVTLDYTASETARVSWATSDGTAVAGEDYTAGSGTLTFAPGETSKTITVAVLDDAHDEGEETLTLTLSTPDGVLLGDAEATGTIANEDPLLNAWLARFGRTVASQTIEAVTERFAAPAGAGSHVTLGGQRIGLSSFSGTEAFQAGRSPSGAGTGPRSGAPDDGLAAPGAPDRGWRSRASTTGEGLATPESDAKQALTALAAVGEAEPGWRSGTGSTPGAGVIPGAPGTAQSRSMTARDLLLASAFHLSTGGGEGHGPRWTAWGRASLEHFENADGGLPVDGEMVTGVFGADVERGDWLTGVALTHGVGEGTMRPRGMAMDYDLDSTVTALHPYARLRLSERLSAWALAGYGEGGLTLTQRREASDGGTTTGRTSWETDLAMTMGAAGARGEVLTPEEADGFALALEGDAFWVRTTSDAVLGVEGLGNLAVADAEASRMRLVLEGSRAMTPGSEPGGRTLTPSLELGVRRDGGDAETGTGLELGAGLAYADPASGVSMDLRARTLLAHAESGYREWGLSGALRVAPGAAGRGLTLTLTPAWGVDAGETDRLWSDRQPAALSPENDGGDASGRLDAEFAYGLAAFGGAFTGTPYAGLGVSDAERRYRLGWRLTGAEDPGAFTVSLEANRRESANDDGHGIGLRATARW